MSPAAAPRKRASPAEKPPAPSPPAAPPAPLPAPPAALPPTPPAPALRGIDNLVSGLFDYAGMFPPAALPFMPALERAARLGQLQRPHMVGNEFVVTASNLSKLGPAALKAVGFASPCRTCVVGVAWEKLAHNLDRVDTFNKAMPPGAQVTSLEVHGQAFPAGDLASAALALRGVRLYVEPQWTRKQWKANRAGIVGDLAALKNKGTPVGLKVRGVGETAIDRTTLVELLPDIVLWRIPLKFTQGLHHPIIESRYHNKLGFVNVVAAIRLHQHHGAAFGRTALKEILRERSAAAYDFSDGLKWRTYHMTEEDLRGAAATIPVSVGSCSLDEPDADLARLWPQT